MSKKTYTTIQTKVINHIVELLREQGNLECNSDNIFTDVYYSLIFTRVIDFILEKAEKEGRQNVAIAMQELMDDIKPEDKHIPKND